MKNSTKEAVKYRNAWALVYQKTETKNTLAKETYEHNVLLVVDTIKERTI